MFPSAPLHPVENDHHNHLILQIKVENCNLIITQINGQNV